MNTEPRIDVTNTESVLEISLKDRDCFYAYAYWGLFDISDPNNPQKIGGGLEYFLPPFDKSSRSITSDGLTAGTYLLAFSYIDGKGLSTEVYKRFDIK